MPLPIRPLQRKLPPAPVELEKSERQLWRRVVETYDFGTDAAALSLLATALEARGRARRCREIIDRDGECVADRFGQLRAHPLLAGERGAQGNFVAAMKSLNLSLGDLQ
jgi:hypothetical protein